MQRPEWRVIKNAAPMISTFGSRAGYLLTQLATRGFTFSVEPRNSPEVARDGSKQAAENDQTTKVLIYQKKMVATPGLEPGTPAL